MDLLVGVFCAPSDPVGVAIVRELADASEVACTTYEHMFGLAKSTIANHIRILRTAGLLAVRKEGPLYHYKVQPECDREHRPRLPRSAEVREFAPRCQAEPALIRALWPRGIDCVITEPHPIPVDWRIR